MLRTEVDCWVASADEMGKRPSRPAQRALDDGAQPLSPTSSGDRGSRSRTRSRAPIRRPIWRCPDGGGSQTPRPARESRRSPSRHDTSKKPTSPDPTSRSASRSTSNRSSVREIAGRCASRSTCGRTRTWLGTPGRSSIACGRGRCRATERGPRTGSPSSNAGSTRERPHEASRWHVRRGQRRGERPRRTSGKPQRVPQAQGKRSAATSSTRPTTSIRRSSLRRGSRLHAWADRWRFAHSRSSDLEDTFGDARRRASPP
jgi:hypothetical protein